MDKDKKVVVIDRSSLLKIREAGIRAFHENAEFGGAQGLELSTLLVILGLESFLKSEKVEVPFTVKIEKTNYRY